MVSKLDYSKGKLRPIILELSTANGYEKPSTYLNEMLVNINKLNFNSELESDDFIFNFYLNVHHLCNENIDRFWSESHKQDITQWLYNSKIITTVFEKTWIKSAFKKTEDNESQQTEADKSDEAKPQHTNIFKGNNFEVWQRMFDEFKITKSSRTDIDFMFQIMKYDELIYDNIGLTDIKIWINNVYEIAFDKIKYTDPKANSNKNRMIAYNL